MPHRRKPPHHTEELVLAALARGALGSRYRPEVVGRMKEAIDRIPSEADRRRLKSTLRALDGRTGAFLLTGRSVPVSWLSPAAAEALLRKWKHGRMAAQRNLSKILLGLSMLSLYGYPTKEWERIGYPGPLGPAPDEPKRLTPLELTSDEVIDCDVVVVGSGAGGGCVAGKLAQAGLDVVVLEKGGYYSERDFHHYEAQATQELYLYGGTLATDDFGCQIIAGSTLGGGTVVNYTTSFRTPEHVLKEWASSTGIDAFVSGEFEQSLDEVSARLGVNKDSSAAGKRDELMEEGLKKLGWHVDMMPRNVRGCTQDEACGYCGFGCRVGGKQSTMRTYLEDAAAAGARLIIRANAHRVIVDDGKATGVEATTNGFNVRVNARAVVVACGSIETPALLLRSELGGQVGRNLHLHPGSAAWGIFEDEVRVWEGTLQARYSDQIRDWDGGYGPIFETVPIHPGAFATVVSWQSAADHEAWMDRYRNISFCAVLPRDKSAGRVRLKKDGGPRIEYKLAADDERRIAEGVIAAAKVLEAAGAKEIYSPHPMFLSYKPDQNGAHERWADETRRIGYRNNKVTFYSYHQMGSCRMGSDPGSSAIGPENESHDVKNLFVTDASAFPTASGVNPMLTIFGIANRAAGKIAERFA